MERADIRARLRLDGGGGLVGRELSRKDQYLLRHLNSGSDGRARSVIEQVVIAGGNPGQQVTVLAVDLSRRARDLRSSPRQGLAQL